MYSLAWFDTFAETVPPAATEGEVAAVLRFAPPSTHPRLLDVGCGTGRTAAPLAACGYDVTGIDASADALVRARSRVTDARFVAMDQRHVGSLRCTFDVAVVFWNSIGFADRAADAETLAGLSRVLRPGGRLLLDLYHPDWLAAHQHADRIDGRGATVTRALSAGRSVHRIRYPNGVTDEIAFNVYRPHEIAALLTSSGFAAQAWLVHWADAEPGPEHARYQVVATPTR